MCHDLPQPDLQRLVTELRELAAYSLGKGQGHGASLSNKTVRVLEQTTTCV